MITPPPLDTDLSLRKTVNCAGKLSSEFEMSADSHVSVPIKMSAEHVYKREFRLSSLFRMLLKFIRSNVTVVEFRLEEADCQSAGGSCDEATSEELSRGFIGWGGNSCLVVTSTTLSVTKLYRKTRSQMYKQLKRSE